MSKRIILAGVLGGIAMFVWTSIAHMVLPLGEAGIKEIPNEPAVLSALQNSAGQSAGLYIFPGLGVGENATSAQKSEAMNHMAEKMEKFPSGILMYHPPGRAIKLPQLLGVEFATELLEALLAVWLLAQTGIATFGGRVGFVLVAGILAALATNVSYWNWYGFPNAYTGAYMLIQVVGFLCVGIVAALVFSKNTN